MANVTLALEQPVTAPAWFEQDSRATAAAIDAALNSKMHRERWKYTQTQPVLELLPAAALAPEIGSHTADGMGPLPEGVTLKAYAKADADAPLLPSIDDAPEASSALCYADQVYLLEVSGEVQTPVQVCYGGHSAPLVIRLAANARLELQEVFTDGVEQQQTLWLDLGPGSALVHARNCFSTATHWQYLRAHIARDAQYTLHNHVGGAQLRRQDMQIVCAGSGAHAEIASAAYIAGGLHLDQQITVEHTAPRSTSNQTFHNIAADKAKVTFNGRIHIHENAPGVDANLANKNLALGAQAVVNTKPELEIYTDDVKCAHGATVGQLDDSHLFYCASRGIDPVQARQLLARAFLKVCTQGALAEAATARFDELAHV